MNLLEVSAQLRGGQVTPLELTRTCLDNIERLNPVLNAFITVTADSALREAEQAGREIREGQWRGPLHGVPVGLKDLIDVAGVRTTAASRVFANHVPTEDAAVVARLKAAGAVLMGKQNAHEFAYGGSSLISAYGPVANACNPSYCAGGSSGGSATAVAAGMCFAAIGTDTAGSVREPASLCGVVGLKPTYGRVSANGVVPLSWALDHIGPITQTAADAALVLEAIAEPNPLPVNSLPVKRERWTGQGLTAPLRLGIPRKFFYEDLDPEVARAVEEALAVLASLTSEKCELELDVTTDRTLSSAESYLYHKSWVKTSQELYDPETLRRIMSGENTTLAQIEAAKADLARRRENIAKVFDQVDVLVTPTTPIPAPTLAFMQSDPAKLRSHELTLLRNTRPFNVWGLPAISVPCGFTRDGLPIGLQIAAAHWREDVVLRVAAAYEQATGWRERHAQGLR